MKELPINLNPYAKTFQYYALPIAALTGENPKNELYMLNNITQVMFTESEHREVFFYPNSYHFAKWKCLNCQFTQKSEIYDNLIDYIRDAIDNGLYFFTYVNDMYIPDRTNYMRNNFEHEIMVHGYDDENLLFLGYDKTGRFNSSKITFSRFEKAFKSLKPDRPVILFNSKKDYENKLDIPLNITLITDYLNSYNSSLRHEDYNEFLKDRIWGVKAFEMVLSDLMVRDIADIRLWDLLCEHKRLMYDRIKFFSSVADVSEIQKRYEDILNSAVVVKNLVMKYIISNNKKMLFYIESNMNELLIYERDVLNDFCTAAKNKT